MKRWQNRGEVLDSDDEELSLGTESQSPERPRKKTRLGDDETEERRTTGAEEAVRDHGEEEEADWLRRTVAVTYGRRSGSSRLPNGENTRNEPEQQDYDGENTVLRLYPPSQQSQVHGNSDVEGHPQSSQSSEDLPDIHQILARNVRKEDVPTPKLDGQGLAALSSPLSEREVSPPPPVEFRFPRFETRPDSREPSTSRPEDGDERLPVGHVVSGEQHTAAAGKRSLRARNEKQLHPYMFDKAQYLQQCRQRGIRPVLYVEVEQRAAETQTASLSGDESESQFIRNDSNSSPPRSSSVLGGDSFLNETHRPSDKNDDSRSQNPGSDDELPDLRRVFQRQTCGSVESGAKRRKLFHVSAVQRSTSLSRRDTSQNEVQDEFSVPPSPPPTSSDSVPAHQIGVGLGGFRMPRGLTPTPLPTPQISSDFRNARVDLGNNVSDDELPSSRSRLSTASRSEPQPQPIAVDSSPESSEAESEPEIDYRRLQRERRRIKGVLPASWLKIDLKAQQKQRSASPPRGRRFSSASPPGQMRQKGVAQRLTSRKSRSPSRADIVTISDDESEPQSRQSSLSPPRMRQLKLQFEREQATAAPSDIVDVDQMEVDWIDPMFAGSSRKRSGASTEKRQPRITDALSRGREQRGDMSEERKTARLGVGTASHRAKPRKRDPHKQRRERPKAYNLSIVDASQQKDSSRQTLPLFVRLAMRNARGRMDRGRHSPTRKQIRLATREDTEHARTLLRAWREGTIVPRQIASTSRNVDMKDTTSDRGPENDDPILHSRRPLTEMSSNSQRTVPAPVRKEIRNKKASTRTSAVTRGPRFQQSRLQPVVIRDEPSAQPQTDQVPPSALTADSAQKRQPNRDRTQLIRYRGAQLESLESEFNQNHRTTAFERRMHVLTETAARRQNRAGVTDFQLARFLDDQGPSPASRPPKRPTSTGHEVGNSHQNFEIPAPSAVLPHRTRKRQTHRIDAEAREYRQPSEPLPEIIDLDRLPDQTTTGVARAIIQGLGPYGTKYATDFDILPLFLGTYFHESTFIGSGDFAASLNFAGRNLDTPTGRISIHVDGDVLEWGAWTEEVAVGLARIPRAVSSALRNLIGNVDPGQANDTVSLVLSNVDYLLRSTIRYFARCVVFLDPVDRLSCVQRLQSFLEDIFEAMDEHGSTSNPSKDILARCLQYALVLARQALGLCDHPLAQADVYARCQALVTRAANRLACHVLPRYLQELRYFYEDNRHAAKRESGIRDSDTAICCTVVLHHILDRCTVQSLFWTAVYKALNVQPQDLNSMLGFDKIWYDIFTVLPVLEIDENGLARVGIRMQGMREDWSLVKKLLDRFFEVYPASSSIPGSTINEYVRATLTRCFRLVNRWGWWRCEPILGTIFDFFARRGLAQLQKEESRGSPKFLGQLDSRPSLEVQADDCSFNIFLKLLASGLQGMQRHGVYADKKIGSIAWRFIPNHGRIHRKDAEVRREDLDALRNHHDLLCTLYYASPPAHRLRVQLVQSLVDYSASHREACRLNVRAWANLAIFQMSNDESTERLDPHIAWYRDIMTTTMSQYRLARTEIEQDVASANAQGKTHITQDIIEDTIARNQRQLCATLVDALAAFKRALTSSVSLANAYYLLEGSEFWQVFDLYDPSARRLNSVVDEAISVVKTALEIQGNFASRIESQNGSDDSQDYGDSSALQVLASTQAAGSTAKYDIANLLHGPVSQLVSNVFGADATTDDTLLTKIVDVWAQLAQVMISTGKRSWVNYIGDYTSDAWSQLRDTEHRRKYTPYFLARLVDAGSVDLADTAILTSWLKSLVEREATLKFQHVLTNALLNQYCKEQLLQNLPFSRHASSPFDISLRELRQRRLSLLSTVLSNMRDDFDKVMREDRGSLSGCRRTYADILKQVMQAMKSNYQQLETSHNEQIADVHARGAYVEFVQHVVSFMQQYTTDICQVDRFFTDSAAFPLPAGDPAYVAGRLRAYVPKLIESRKRKELAVFIQTVSERAAVDGEQTYLVDQLANAMSGNLEHGNAKTPSLRHVLMTTIFRAYIENALSTACSWIVAKPILHACGMATDELLSKVKWEDERSTQAIKDLMLALLHSMTQPMELALAHPGLVLLPHAQSILAAVFETARRCLTPAHHLQRSTQIGRPLADMVSRCSEYATKIEAKLSDLSEFDPLEPINTEADIQCLWPDTLDFSRKQLQDKFNSDWYAHDGQYFVRRGNSSAEVVVDLKDEDEERSHLLEALTQFRESFETIFNGPSRVQLPAHDSCGISGMMV